MLSLSLDITSHLSSPSLTIAIASGGGYAGSLYRASRPGGQWHADGVPVAGASGPEWTMTMALEGAAITYRLGPQTSNTIKMWMPTDLPASYRLNGGWWDPKRGITTSSGRVSAIADQFGVRPMVQATVANQPDYTPAASDGGPAIVWPETANTRFLAPAAPFAPAYWIFVMRYRNGTVATFPSEAAVPDGDYPAIISSGASPNRVMGERGTANLFQTSVWTGTARKNAAPTPSATLLPLPKSLVELQGVPVSALWSLGRGAGAVQDDPAAVRGWRGTFYDCLALGQVPTDSMRDFIVGCLAWRNGLQSSLPNGHTFRHVATMLR
ncbi:hypothetical protein [Ciceribacter sp. L1K22]|uniref:hypothetical protein n=1 Tax=Ciceribacter sp. L1K22 TaxID=2820275 RepID=UPI001ABDFB74|nr:hypothetical protein [Ciceribacter sp. L1K22]MBO3762224.1 hypothetical protein [Ciceribacter sp. L1K22]